jgi:hypothetical protein
MNAYTQHSSPSGPRRRHVLVAAAATSMALMLLPTAALAVTTGTVGPVPKSGSISGRITGDGHPLAGQCAEAANVAANTVGFGSAGRNGKYRIAHLRPGQYQVLFAPGIDCAHPGNWLEQWYPNRTSPNPPAHPVRVRVRANEDTAGINGNLKEGAEIAGVVHSRSGKPLNRICVNVTGVLPHHTTVEIAEPSNRQGRYEAHGLFPGRYTVEFTGGCGSQKKFAAQWYLNASSQKKATVIKITGPEIFTGVNANLRPR